MGNEPWMPPTGRCVGAVRAAVMHAADVAIGVQSEDAGEQKAVRLAKRLRTKGVLGFVGLAMS